jgi:hypothetical protein
MSRGHRIGLAELAGISLGAGALLWLALATDRLPDGGVLIALGAVVLAGAAQLPLLLGGRGQRGCENAGSRETGPADTRS